MQVTRPKIKSGYGDIRKIVDFYKERNKVTISDVTVRNALVFATDGDLAKEIRRIATEEIKLPIIEEPIEV